MPDYRGIVNTVYKNCPFNDVFSKFEKNSEGKFVLSPEQSIERAKIAANNGFLVDPITGDGFWALSDWRNTPIENAERKIIK